MKCFATADHSTAWQHHPPECPAAEQMQPPGCPADVHDRELPGRMQSWLFCLFLLGGLVCLCISCVCALDCFFWCCLHICKWLDLQLHQEGTIAMDSPDQMTVDLYTLLRHICHRRVQHEARHVKSRCKIIGTVELSLTAETTTNLLLLGLLAFDGCCVLFLVAHC